MKIRKSTLCGKYPTPKRCSKCAQNMDCLEYCLQNEQATPAELALAQAMADAIEAKSQLKVVKSTQVSPFQYRSAGQFCNGSSPTYFKTLRY